MTNLQYLWIEGLSYVTLRRVQTILYALASKAPRLHDISLGFLYNYKVTLQAVNPGGHQHIELVRDDTCIYVCPEDYLFENFLRPKFRIWHRLA